MMMISGGSKRDDLSRVERNKGWLRLCAGIVTMSILWLLVLPWIARRPSVEDRLRFLEERSIDPSAMFYTELDAMDPILEKLEK